MNLLVRVLDPVAYKLLRDTSHTGSLPSCGFFPPFARGTQTVVLMKRPATSTEVFFAWGKGPVPPEKATRSSGTRFAPVIVIATQELCDAEPGLMAEICGTG